MELKMNFEELMRHAADNKINAMRQQRKAGRGSKDGTSVSSSAVQAFLKKKEEEKKQQQAEAEAARRARIQARLEANLNKKSTKKGKPTKGESFKSDEQTTSQMESRKETAVSTGRIPKKNPIQSQQRNSEQERNFKPERSKRKFEKPAGPVRNNGDVGRVVEDKVSTKTTPVAGTKKNSKSKKPPTKPVNFKDLLAIAEKNKSGERERKIITNGNKNDSRAESQQELDHQRETSKKNNKHPAKRPHPESAKASNISKISTSKRTEANVAEKSALRREPTVKSAPARTIRPEGTKLRGPAQRDPLMGRPGQLQPRGPMPRRPPLPERGYSESDYEDEFDDFIDDDDDDDFIDDGDAEPDVSAHIREIFGYDKRKFKDEVFDDRTMESSYSQLEKEEARSSKIAKLEDEIEFLKEQALLKKQKAALMTKSKKGKK